ncbi:DUF2231 domain-containing protein [Sediminibacterium sp.]|jgi:uncharacterized membrane protein|uniref:DUF2231 domain-containing protein n=1 Tax=Sediminibacterium sp. TaxID=1917865 RepID=UPI0011D96CD9|nr:DUF2231 domain-containing protein [Sediminibacterium sp.]KAF0239792.1 MAG: hypothetical protein FD183_1318 [Chitinophagaceae bacterium]MDP1818242.1 hypothetical protein [Leadbetterella sp.]MDP3393526.1 hypothetical protein [Sediminibacterium sp.]MDP3566703.1 hypothetical protein [Sediminibacterium sp.]TXT31119.1 MAG: hypothetical protein FD136_1564 [Chitinophagaceae bacterium]
MISSTHLHAMVVHFPIALLMVAFLFEVTSYFYKKEFFRQSAFYLLVLGMLGTVVSYLAGNAAGEGMEEGPLNKAMELHEQAATISLWLTIITALLYGVIYFLKFNKGWLRIIGFLLFTGVIGSIARTGYLGGQLVYKHGAGVELALPDFSSPDEK